MFEELVKCLIDLKDDVKVYLGEELETGRVKIDSFVFEAQNQYQSGLSLQNIAKKLIQDLEPGFIIVVNDIKKHDIDYTVSYIMVNDFPSNWFLRSINGVYDRLYIDNNAREEIKNMYVHSFETTLDAFNYYIENYPPDEYNLVFYNISYRNGGINVYCRPIKKDMIESPKIDVGFWGDKEIKDTLPLVRNSVTLAPISLSKQMSEHFLIEMRDGTWKNVEEVNASCAGDIKTVALQDKWYQTILKNHVNCDDFLRLLNSLDVTSIPKTDLYAYFFGDKTALNKYKGDKE